MTGSNNHICPVCGFDGLAGPAYDKKGFGSLETCPSCGFQYNVSDTKMGWSFHDWRVRWVSNGMRWSSLKVAAPAQWNPQNQLGRLHQPDND